MTNAVNIAQGGSNNVTMRNRIINGAMVINQRGWSGNITTGNEYTLDRFQGVCSVSNKFSVSQSTSVYPAGFNFSLLVTSQSAYTVGAAEQFVLRQNIEAYNTNDLAWGTASASTVTLSFWVRSSLTGTFGGALFNSNGSRSYPFTYTISSANTWEQKTITIAGDTSGTWAGTNGVGITVSWGLGVGSTYSGTAGAWAGTYYASATGAVSVVGTSGATFYVTGVQLEAGTTASPFEYRQYGTELALCQRYFLMWANGGGQNIGLGGYYNSTYVTTSIAFPVTMRSAPTLTQTSGTNYYGIYSNNTLDYFDSFSSGIQQPTVNCAGIDCSTNVSGTSGALGRMVANSGAYIGFSAEL